MMGYTQLKNWFRDDNNFPEPVRAEVPLFYRNTGGVDAITSGCEYFLDVYTVERLQEYQLYTEKKVEILSRRLVKQLGLPGLEEYKEIIEVGVEYLKRRLSSVKFISMERSFFIDRKRLEKTSFYSGEYYFVSPRDGELRNLLKN